MGESENLRVGEAPGLGIGWEWLLRDAPVWPRAPPFISCVLSRFSLPSRLRLPACRSCSMPSPLRSWRVS